MSSVSTSSPTNSPNSKFVTEQAASGGGRPMYAVPPTTLNGPSGSGNAGGSSSSAALHGAYGVVNGSGSGVVGGDTLGHSNGGGSPPMLRQQNFPAPATASTTTAKQYHEGFYNERTGSGCSPTEAGAATQSVSRPAAALPPPPPSHAPSREVGAPAPVVSSSSSTAVQPQQHSPVPETTLRGPGRGPGQATGGTAATSTTTTNAGVNPSNGTASTEPATYGFTNLSSGAGTAANPHPNTSNGSSGDNNNGKGGSGSTGREPISGSHTSPLSTTALAAAAASAAGAPPPVAAAAASAGPSTHSAVYNPPPPLPVSQAPITSSGSPTAALPPSQPVRRHTDPAAPATTTSDSTQPQLGVRRPQQAQTQTAQRTDSAALASASEPPAAPPSLQPTRTQAGPSGATTGSGGGRTRARPPQGVDAGPVLPPQEQQVPAVPSTTVTSTASAAAAPSGGAYALPTRPPALPPPQQQQQHTGHPPAPVAPPTAAQSTEQVEAADPAFARPAKALSAQLMALYKVVNARYCNQRRLATPGPKYNRGFDDKEGHYIVLPGEEILSRYTVQEVLGKGSFGTVLRCYDEKRREAVALKITRHGSNFRSQAKLELDILLKLNENPNLNHLVVKLLKVFDWQGHLVLVFELLSFNLYQLIKCTRYNGVSLELVRKFAYQLVCTLLQLEQQKPQPIIHCDIKPENILLRNQNRSGIRLIDFGSACYADKCIHKYIQSRFYRCPEVILYLGYTTAIDRWSLGCVLVELHTGMPLFDGRTEAAQLARFEATLGPVPTDMISRSCKAHKFYNTGSNGSSYQLKEPQLVRRSLESVIGVTTGGPRGSRRGTQGHDEASYWEFLDFITQLLRYHPEERITCQDALRHPFLAPLYLSDQQQRHARRQQQQEQQPSAPQGASSTTNSGAAPEAPASSSAALTGKEKE